MREALELKVPPPAVWLICAATIWFLGNQFEDTRLLLPGRAWLALAVLLVGAGLAVRGVLVFRRHGTTVHPQRPERTSAIVTSDVYALTRNPMYLGLALALLAWALWTGSLLGAFLCLPAFVLYLNEFQIKPEERALQRAFGDEYARYCGAVRRWV